MDIFTTSAVTEPGLYRMPEADYHADPCPEPSLSRSIALKIIDESAHHAWEAHPKLNPSPVDDGRNDRRMEIGSAAHACLLCQNIEIRTLDYENFATKASREERDAAKAEGAIPLLRTDRALVYAMHNRAKEDLALSDDPVILNIVQPDKTPMTSYNEITACWRDMGGIWCRARMDRLVIQPDRITIIDYKTTEMSAAPQSVAKAIFNNAYHLQDGFYRRGIRHLFPAVNTNDVMLDFMFIVQEQEPPHEITVARIAAPGRVIGEKMASAGVRLWHDAIIKNEWPGYPKTVASADMPPFVETRWLAREIEDPRFQGLTIDPMGPQELHPFKQPDKGDVFWG